MLEGRIPQADPTDGLRAGLIRCDSRPNASEAHKHPPVGWMSFGVLLWRRPRRQGL